MIDAVALRSLRLGLAMTQQELARAAGVSRVTVSRLELGSPASAYSIKRIALALGVATGTISKVVHV